MFRFNVFFIVLLSSSVWSQEDPDGLIVGLVKPRGRIRGHLLKTSRGKEFYAFQDVPFAAPPTGNRRFKAPEPHEGWGYILNATENKKICVQFPLFTNEEPTEEETEDCLVLNVYTPVRPGSKSSLPILFWTYGGGYSAGSGRLEEYNPSYFMNADIIVVTSNYRLGPLGFLSTGDDIVSGNLGLKDQHLALAWTAENIHLFGGDPKKIVIAGQSAGSYSSGLQLLSERNAGLFRGVIQQSGSPLIGGGFQTNPKQYAIQLIQKLDGTHEYHPENITKHIEVLRTASIDKIRAATKMIEDRDFPNGFLPAMIWIPVMENKMADGAMVTSPIRQSFMDGNFNLVPVLTGITSEESLHYLSAIPSSTFNDSARLIDNDPSLLVHPRLNIKENERKTVGSLLKATYTSSTFTEDKLALIRFTSDVYFNRAAIEQAHLMARHVPVYFYQFCLGEIPNSPFPGAPHTAEIPYIWYDKKVEATLEEENRSRVMKLWTNFIKYLNPTPEEDPLLGNIKWKKLDPLTLNYLNINENLSMKVNPRNHQEIRKILNKYVQQPFNVF